MGCGPSCDQIDKTEAQRGVKNSFLYQLSFVLAPRTETLFWGIKYFIVCHIVPGHTVIEAMIIKSKHSEILIRNKMDPVRQRKVAASILWSVWSTFLVKCGSITFENWSDAVTWRHCIPHVRLEHYRMLEMFCNIKNHYSQYSVIITELYLSAYVCNADNQVQACTVNIETSTLCHSAGFETDSCLSIVL